MIKDRKIKRKFIDAVGNLVEATKNLRQVSIEVLAEADATDEETKYILDLTSQIAQGMMPLEVLHLQMEKKLSEE